MGGRKRVDRAWPPPTRTEGVASPAGEPRRSSRCRARRPCPAEAQPASSLSVPCAPGEAVPPRDASGHELRGAVDRAVRSRAAQRKLAPRRAGTKSRSLSRLALPKQPREGWRTSACWSRAGSVPDGERTEPLRSERQRRLRARPPTESADRQDPPAQA